MFSEGAAPDHAELVNTAGNRSSGAGTLVRADSNNNKHDELGSIVL